VSVLLWQFYFGFVILGRDVTSIQDNFPLIFSLYTPETFNCFRPYAVFNYEASVPYHLFFILHPVPLYHNIPCFFLKRGILFRNFNSSSLSLLFNSQFEAVWSRLLAVQAVETFLHPAYCNNDDNAVTQVWIVFTLRLASHFRDWVCSFFNTGWELWNRNEGGSLQGNDYPLFLSTCF
jgi:hypothetical protein